MYPGRVTLETWVIMASQVPMVFSEVVQLEQLHLLISTRAVMRWEAQILICFTIH